MIIFLYNARLIMKDNPRIYLADIDLSGANLAHSRLSGINLRKSNLSQANFTAARLTGADLSQSQLTATDFTDANLSGAEISEHPTFGQEKENQALIKSLSRAQHWQKAVLSPQLQEAVKRLQLSSKTAKEEKP
ncbi:pentapeptide repeat-containing protein [Thalassomonas haliotis]|uniref:Pentapeptide repeat-containing protein n=2 Tax=Thalassomonas haliotis TaxID=485448 RepID=A0ABY7VN55_9GAMM|nr:pentapeptide repeat-containing protein [Thalassomonas haliotis]